MDQEMLSVGKVLQANLHVMGLFCNIVQEKHNTIWKYENIMPLILYFNSHTKGLKLALLLCITFG